MNTSSSVKVMPDNCLYWYGNECTDVTGGWDGTYIDKVLPYKAIQKNTNNISFSLTTNSSSFAYTKNTIAIDSTIKYYVTSTIGYIYATSAPPVTDDSNFRKGLIMGINSATFTNRTSNISIGIYALGDGNWNNALYAIWLE